MSTATLSSISPADFLTAVFADGRCRGGTQISARHERMLNDIQATAGSDESNTVSDPAGGFLAPQSFTTALEQRAWDFSRIAGRCRKFPVSGRELSLPLVREASRVNGSRFGGVISTWTPETLPITTSHPLAQAVRLRPGKLVVLIPATDELIADAPAFLEFVLSIAAEEIAVQLDTAILQGEVNGPAGILGDPSLITVTKDEGQDAGTITQSNVTNAIARLWPYSDSTAVWFCSRSAQQSIYAEQNLWHLLRFAGPEAEPGAPRATLAGYPLIPVEQAQPVGTPGDLSLVDPRQYVLGDKGGPSMIRSVHVRFINHESMLKITYRVDGKASWMQPVTPMFDTAAGTQGPFVAIAARS